MEIQFSREREHRTKIHSWEVVRCYQCALHSMLLVFHPLGSSKFLFKRKMRELKWSHNLFLWSHDTGTQSARQRDHHNREATRRPSEISQDTQIGSLLLKYCQNYTYICKRSRQNEVGVSFGCTIRFYCCHFDLFKHSHSIFRCLSIVFFHFPAAYANR